MNTKNLLSLTCLAAFATVCLTAEKLLAQAPEEPLQLVLDYGEPSETRLLSRQGLVAPVRLVPNQVMAFTLQFPVANAGLPVAIESLDGGQVNAIPPQENTIVSVDGTARFSFQAGQTFGLYRVVVQLPGEQYHLHFRLIDPNP